VGLTGTSYQTRVTKTRMPARGKRLVWREGAKRRKTERDQGGFVSGASKNAGKVKKKR